MAKNSKTCGNCHILIFDEYKESFHGIAMGYGYEAVVNCSSCHGVHNILPAKNPLSKVNPANLAETCGQESCHPGMPEKIASSKIHIDVGQKKSGVPYYIQQILLWIVFTTAIITLIWFVPGFIRKIKLIKNK